MGNTKWMPRMEPLPEGSLLEKAMAARGAPAGDREFLRPELSDLLDPMLLPDMEKAAARVIGARERGEKVTVYGDYDVDGTAATAILVSYFRAIGIDADFHIPNRLTEGYGMNVPAVEEIAGRGTALVVTVDTGIAALEPAERAAELGMDLVVTDHHEPQGKLPRACAVVDAKREDSVYPCKEICGASAAFKLVCAIDSMLGLSTKKTSLLQLAAVATIADVVELSGENRTIAKLGLGLINRYGPQNKGLAALVAELGLDSVDSWSAAFKIAPAINAAGRLGDTEAVSDLFLSGNAEKTRAAAKRLVELNERRKEIEKETAEEAAAKVLSEGLHMDPVIVVCGRDWHPGVVGIVASRLQESWNTPILVASSDGSGVCKGSGRSIEGFNLFEALSACSDCFESFGGHEQAAGFSIREERIPELRERLRAYAAGIDMDSLPGRALRYDGEVRASELTTDAVRELAMLEPFGQGNPRPLFLFVPEDITEPRAFGNGNAHLRTRCDGIDSVWFGRGDEADRRFANHHRLLVEPGIDSFRGEEKVELVVRADALKNGWGE